jgi:hypothetical protein
MNDDRETDEFEKRHIVITVRVERRAFEWDAGTLECLADALRLDLGVTRVGRDPSGGDPTFELEARRDDARNPELARDRAENRLKRRTRKRRKRAGTDAPADQFGGVGIEIAPRPDAPRVLREPIDRIARNAAEDPHFAAERGRREPSQPVAQVEERKSYEVTAWKHPGAYPRLDKAATGGVPEQRMVYVKYVRGCVLDE